MPIVAERELLIISTAVAVLAIVSGGLYSWGPPPGAGYLGYALAGGGGILLTTTALAWCDRRILSPLRYLLGGLIALLFVGILLGYDPTSGLRPKGRFVSLGIALQMPA